MISHDAAKRNLYFLDGFFQFICQEKQEVPLQIPRLESWESLSHSYQNSGVSRCEEQAFQRGKKYRV